jgi:hypothetical protein
MDDMDRHLSVSLPWRANFGKVRHRVPIGHLESPQFCGVSGCFDDDDIELYPEIDSICGMAFIGNEETVCYLMLYLYFNQVPNKHKK